MRFRPALLAACCLVPPSAWGVRPAAAQTAAPPPAAPAAEDPLLARVDGQEVRMSDVVAVAAEVLPPELRSLPPAMLMQVLPPEVSRQLVDRAIT